MLKVRIREMNQEDLENPKTIKQISDLIYYSDIYVYPDLFGSKRKARKILNKWFREVYGIFNMNNIVIATRDNKVIGVIVAVNTTDDCAFALGPTEGFNLPKTFDAVKQEHFQRIENKFNEPALFIASISVRPIFRGNHIAGMMSDYARYKCKAPVYTYSLATNEPMLGYLKNEKFKEIESGIAYGGVETIEFFKRD